MFSWLEPMPVSSPTRVRGAASAGASLFILNKKLSVLVPMVRLLGVVGHNSMFYKDFVIAVMVQENCSVI